LLSSLLRIHNVSKRFGGLQALSDVHLELLKGEIYGLIGPNGAGKTTLFNLITGLYQADSGSFYLENKEFFPGNPIHVTQIGIARTFQNIRLFERMTALQNVMVGRHVRTQQGALGAIFRTKKQQLEEDKIKQYAMTLLERVGLKSIANQPASTLSYGDQRRLEIARALATEPLILALDEPAAGMNPSEKQTLKHLLLDLKSDGISLLLIEHDVKLVMGLCNTITVLDHGKVIAQGQAQEIRRCPAVIQAYLGSNDR
jgi:branched-chain amino acid transport system ATP-binding protein